VRTCAESNCRLDPLDALRQGQNPRIQPRIRFHIPAPVRLARCTNLLEVSSMIGHRTLTWIMAGPASRGMAPNLCSIWGSSARDLCQIKPACRPVEDNHKMYRLFPIRSVLLLLFALVVVAPARAQSEDAFALRVDEILHASELPYLHRAGLGRESGVLRTLYGNRAGEPLWEQSGKPSAQALSLLQTLQDAQDDGLDPAQYEADLLARKLAELQSGPDATAAAWADWDVALSAVALRFIRHLHYGRIDPHRAGFDLNIPRAAIDLPATMEQLAGASDFAGTIAAIEPHFRHYHLLKSALAKYRQLAADETLTTLPGFAGKSIRPGQAYAGAAALRQRLSIFGDLPQADVVADKAASSEVLDEVLAAALSRFQQRHGLTMDGILGKGTLAALNVPPAVRVRQIELSLERWRWLPEFATPPIIVNIPEFRLFAFQSNEDLEEGMLNMEVVVGQAYQEKRTPVFLGSLQYVVFRPYWDVPPSIARREILPAVRRDSRYLQAHHMELVRGGADNSPVVEATAGNIALLAAGKIRMRQIPGPDNALGEIKFLLPNPYNVYLHSTPAHQLFAQARRAFSHGCIRVSDPTALAAYVLRNAGDEWPAERIDAAMNGAPNQRVRLSQPIQVMILYATAVAAESGRIYFFDDIYGHDHNLEKLLGLTPAALKQ